MTKKKKIGRLIGLVLVIVLLFGGYYVYSMFSFLHTVNTNHKYSQGTPLTTVQWDGTTQVNILLMGVDARGTDPHPRSDSILLASINPNTKKVALFSIMRDSYVTIPGIGQSKINAAFADGGPELVIQTVSKFLNIPINYYVATDFEGFSKIVDDVGGIDVNIPQPFVHPDDGVYDINLPAGQQHLNGHQALEYVRYRGTPRADFDRTERQREVLKMLATKLKSPTNMLKFPTLLKDIEPYTQTNLSADDLLKLASLGTSLDTQGMKTEQIPPLDALSESYDSAGEQVLMPDIPKTQQFVQQIIQSEGGSTTSSQSQSSGEASQAVNAQPASQPSSGNGNGNGTSDNSDNNSSSNNNNNASGNANGPTGSVSADVNIRQKPGTDYPVIGQLHAGDTVTIEGQSGDWDFVQTKDGMQGYVLGSLLTVQ